MRQDLTDITMVIDRSGSMASCRTDAEGGINHFIAEQKKADGFANLTLTQFDTSVETIHSGKNIQDIPDYILCPRGGTALLDAIGRAINETGNRLSAMAESDRPGLVVFVIVTDGAENSSCEFKREQIQEMIKHQEEKYRWQFVFLGANTEAFAQASSIGIRSANAAQYTGFNSKDAYDVVSKKLCGSRYGGLQGEWLEGGPTMDCMAFDDSERERMVAPKS